MISELTTEYVENIEKHSSNIFTRAGSSHISLLWLTVVLLFAAAVTAVNVHLAYQNGPLVAQPRYDDVSYFVWTLNRLEYWHQFGFTAFVIDHFRHPPHSPFSTALAYLGFGLFGKNVWACYVANYVVVATLLLSVAWITRTSSIWLRSAILLYVSTISFTTWAVWNFRPDLFWGVCAAWACFYILNGSLKDASARYIWPGAVLVALAFLSKPTIFPATTISLGAAVVLNLVANRASSKNELLNQIKGAVKVVGFGLLIAAPYYIANARHLTAYIKEVVFGHTGQIASFANAVGTSAPSSKLDEYRCYFDGFAGMANFGGNQYLLLSLIIGAGIIFALQRRTQELKLLLGGIALIGLMFAIPTLTSAKGTFFASNFVAALILLGLWSVSKLESPLRPFRTALLTGLIVLLSGASISMKTSLWPDASDPAVANEKKGFELLYSAMSERAGDREISFTSTTEGPFLVFDFMFRAALERKIFDLWHSAQHEYAPADFVIAQDDAVPGSVDKSKAQSELLAKLYKDTDYNEIAEWSAWNGRKVVLFERLGDFYGVSGRFGLVSTQRTGPLWRIRVANSERCGLLLQDTPGHMGGTLVLGCVPQAGISALRILAAGKSIAVHQFKQGRYPEEIVVNVPPELGRNPQLDVTFEGEPASGVASATFTKMKFVDIPGHPLVCKRDQASVLSYPGNSLDTHEW